MPFPPFLQPARSRRSQLTLPAGPPAVAGVGAGGQTLSFVIHSQTQGNWCWAAVASNVSDFYTPGSPWSQCAVSDAALGRADCCGAGAAGPCDVPWYLDSALTVTGNFHSLLAASIPVTAIQVEIGAGRPIGCRVGWSGGGGHFMAIAGWLVGPSGAHYIEIRDPIYLNTTIALTAFAGSYHGGGTWTHTYFTQPPAGSVAAALGGGWHNPGDPAMLGA